MFAAKAKLVRVARSKQKFKRPNLATSFKKAKFSSKIC